MSEFIPDVIKIMLHFQNDEVGVMQFIIDDKRGLIQNTTPAAIEETITKMEPSLEAKWLPIKNWELIDDKDIPADRTYRNAWKVVDGAIITDMTKAKNLHKDDLRIQRIPLLESLDIQYQKADEKADQKLKASIALDKQKLRDVTNDARIEQAQTPEELKLLTIDLLTQA